MSTLVYLSGRRGIGQIVETETIFPIIGTVVVLINTNETIVDTAITDEEGIPVRRCGGRF